MTLKIITLLLIFLITYANQQTNQQSFPLSYFNAQGQRQEKQLQIQGSEPGNSQDQKQQNAEAVVENNPNHNYVQSQGEEEHGYITPSSPQFIKTVLFALSLCGAFCSGMGVGLLSISKLELQMMQNKQNEEQVKMASMILKVVSNHHLFLVTLLIANAMALQTLPLIIHLMMPDFLAVIFSTFIVLIVAEIVPQAVCTGPNKLKIAYYASPIILIMIKIFWILAYPTAKLLDYLVGDQHDQKIQHKDFAKFLSDDKFLNKTEKQLLTSTLELRGERVRSVMIPVESFFMLQENDLITKAIAQKIFEKDYSYILVYKQKRGNITGTIKVKQFAISYLKQNKPEIIACTVMKNNAKMLTVYEDTNLLEMLMLFQAKSTRVALVCNQKRKIDPNIKSIMYSKSDMVYSSNEGKRSVEVLGVVFLYQIFSNMAELKVKIQRQSRTFSINANQQPFEQEMSTLKRPLMK